ncbi:hypothetical protein [Mesorhizobium sp. WSM3862]|uniref:hypothetical protein n=1 Tax=Mesorhizobium sp. WSM3862 TaxID=632858 RepID=UPI001140A47E|nr:hypothetical protein [Mesorhizobium sp. WSM3862]
MNPGASRTAADHHIVQDDPALAGLRNPDQLRPASAKRDALQPIFAGDIRGGQARGILKAKLAYYRCSTEKVLYWAHLQGAIDKSFEWADLGQRAISATSLRRTRLRRAGLRRRRHRLPMRSSSVASMNGAAMLVMDVHGRSPHKGTLGHQPPLVETTQPLLFLGSTLYAQFDRDQGYKPQPARHGAAKKTPPRERRRSSKVDGMEQPFETASKART